MRMVSEVDLQYKICIALNVLEVLGVPPVGEVEGGQLPSTAGQPGVQLVVGEEHGPQLDGLHRVRVVADQSRQGGLSDCLQLLQGEAARPAGVLVPVPVSGPEVEELVANDAGEGGSDKSSSLWQFAQATGPKVYVLW